MTPKFTRGAPLTASDLNALTDEACMNIMGGSGVAITRLGKKLVVNKRLGQKIQRGGYATVWGFASDISTPVWTFDTKGTRAYAVAANDSYVYCTGNAGDTDDTAKNVFALNTNGGRRWDLAIQSDTPSHTVIGPNGIDVLGDDLYIGSYIGYFDDTTTRTILKRYDVDDGGEVASFVSPFTGTISPAAGFRSPRSDGTYIWGTHASSYDNRYLYKIASDLSSHTLSAHTVVFSYRTSNIFASSNGTWICGSSPGGFDPSEKHFNTSAVYQWSTMGNLADVVAVGSDSYWVGERNNAWPGSGGDYANWWKEDSTGAITADADVTSGNLRTCALLGTHMYVGGNRVSSGLTASGYANMWKIDLAGAIVAAYDFGLDEDGNEVDVHQIRTNSTQVIVATDRQKL